MSIDITEYKKISSQLSAMKQIPLPNTSSLMTAANTIQSLLPHDVLNSLSKEFLPSSAMLETISSVSKISFEPLDTISASLSKLKDSFPKYASVSNLMADLYKEKINDTNIMSVTRMLSETLSPINKDTYTVVELLNAGTSAINSLNDSFHQSEEECLDLPESLTQLISSIDDSIEFPDSDSDKIVHIKGGSDNFWTIVGVILTIISIAVALYCHYSSTISDDLHHAERMREEQRQTTEMKQQTDLLRQILESTSSNPEDNTEPVESATAQSL